VKIFSQIKDYLSDGTNWKGSTGIPTRLAEHLEISALAVVIACAIAIPIGLWIGHVGKGGAVAVNISNIGRAIPTYALLVLLFVAVGVTHRQIEAVISLIAFAIPPLLTNTYVGVREVDPEVREAAKGMGMSGTEMLRRVEIPLALPLIMDGVRIAVVQVIATTSIAALIGVGGLGRLVVDGFNNTNPGEYGSGALIIAVLALAFEGLFVLILQRIDPRTRARRRGRADSARAAAAGEGADPALVAGSKP
jgi:osmoprotectant transport system permease protein